MNAGDTLAAAVREHVKLFPRMVGATELRMALAAYETGRGISEKGQGTRESGSEERPYNREAAEACGKADGLAFARGTLDKLPED